MLGRSIYQFVARNGSGHAIARLAAICLSYKSLTALFNASGSELTPFGEELKFTCAVELELRPVGAERRRKHFIFFGSGTEWLKARLRN